MAGVKGKCGRKSKIGTVSMSKVRGLAEKGYTDKEMASALGICDKTIRNWKKRFPAFFESLQAGKLLADSKVVASLYQRACGYSCPDVYMSTHQGVVTKTPIIKHYPPDVTSMIFWLKNRKPAEWRDRQDLNLGGQDGNQLPPMLLVVKDVPVDQGEKTND